MDDIDALFTGNVVASAVDTFTDRLPQAEAFSDAVLAHPGRHGHEDGVVTRSVRRTCAAKSTVWKPTEVPAASRANASRS